MSAADAKKFMAHVKKDPVLRKKLVKESHAAMDRAVKIARKHGYKITKEDFHKHLKKQWAAKKPSSSRKADAFTCVAMV